ncbi:heterokaryon incompatibility protein-domain-containing protein [Xylariaceae sp. FL1019]|nr:heterokaryon incompatibility protein-domain-containing protein [Xylariaceae sp. FL1019]
MRLINAATLQLEEFDNPSTRPDYAILSHRWAHGEEVSFHDMKGAHGWMPGWSKIIFCCRQTLQDGLTHAWVDTCCIDKDSSAELSEAINSMYDWYSNARICYAYLNDVDMDTKDRSKDAPLSSRIAESLWFTRAWTLQELLAPKHVVFYDRLFSRLASKHDIAEEAQHLIGIPTDVLADPENLLLYPVATRMSWAASRKATRVEDVAYSLFGIFQVNLPLLYGEGDRAFIRLQEEIIKHSHDHSIFAWTAKDVESVRLGRSDMLPLLAPSLARFEGCGTVSTMEEDHEIRAYSMTNIGLEIELQVTPYNLDVYAALLDCGPGSSWTRYAILLARESSRTTRFYRVAVRGQSLVEVPPSNLASFKWQKMHIVSSPQIEYRRRKRSSNAVEGGLIDQFYGIRIHAPEFLQHDEALRPYALVAHYDWEDALIKSPPIENRGNFPHLKYMSRTVSKLSPLSNAALALPGREMANSQDDDTSEAFRAVQAQRPDSDTNGGLRAGIPTSPPRATMHHMDLPRTKDIPSLSQGASSASMQRADSSREVMKPIGSLEMPLLSTGTAGVSIFWE